MSDSGASGVNALAIIAILILVGLAGYWYYDTQYTPRSRNVDVKVEVPAPADKPADPAPSNP